MVVLSPPRFSLCERDTTWIWHRFTWRVSSAKQKTLTLPEHLVLFSLYFCKGSPCNLSFVPILPSFHRFEFELRFGLRVGILLLLWSSALYSSEVALYCMPSVHAIARRHYTKIPQSPKYTRMQHTHSYRIHREAVLKWPSAVNRT